MADKSYDTKTFVTRNVTASSTAQKKEKGIGLPSVSSIQLKEKPLQNKGPEEEEPLQMKAVAQLVGGGHQEEEEPLQMKAAIQLKGNVMEELPTQEKFIIQRKENKTGLPDNLKTGVENLSGYSLDDVKVHYNSSQPAQLNAHAYAQGTDIHVAAGQEQHLAHEAWHVVQQKQGRVKPTVEMKENVAVNDDPGLEHEADIMGAKAMQMKIKEPAEKKGSQLQPVILSKKITQLEKYIKDKTDIIHLHLDIGKGDHLMIGADRYNLMGKSGYSPARLQTALDALNALPGGNAKPGFAECKAWLESELA